MKRILMPLALLLCGLASALTSTQREQHIDQIFRAAGFVAVPCRDSAIVADLYCARTQRNDLDIQRSWDLYADWDSKVTATATLRIPWKLNASASSYSGVFGTADGDAYVVTSTIGNSDNFIAVSWINVPPPVIIAPVISAAVINANASSSTSYPASECAPGALRVVSSDGTGWIAAEWKQPASFPTPSRTMKVGGFNQDYFRVCPTFEAKYDHLTGEYVFRGQEFQNLIDHSGISRYNGASSIDLMDKKGSGQLVTLGIMYNKTSQSFQFKAENATNFAEATLGYRVNSGTLQPLYFEKELSDLILPASTRTLEIYAMPGQSTAWQYLKLDLQTNTLTLKRNFTFPQK